MHSLRSLFSAFCFFLLTCGHAVAQNVISGVINKYTAVTAFNCDSTRLTVNSISGFFPGDKVLLIQMKGATVSLDNNSTFGDIVDFGNAGNYEFNRVESITGGNSINLKFRLSRSYDIAGKVQLVRVPEYDNVTADGLICGSWDGSAGGVLVLDVANTLTLQGNLDVSGRGFRGGMVVDADVLLYHETQYFYPPDPALAAEKGEGIAIVPVEQSYGRGKSSTGGGGGNAHNAGGGGGGNGGKGGNGGLEYYNTPSSPTPGTDGIGGLSALGLSTQKILLGGGGGAGHTNDEVGTSGGNGGGIIIVIANTVEANGFKMMANGDNVVADGTNRNDGQGGGGAGGTILLKANQVNGSLPLEVKGGNGANCLFYVNSQIIGPGGGGGGGKVGLSQLFPSVMLNLNGGQNGIANQNLSNGAQPGQAGSVLFPLVLPVDTTTSPTLDLGPDVILCFDSTVVFDAGPGFAQYLWQDSSTAQTFATSDIGVYWVEVTDACGVKQRDSVLLTVNLLPDTRFPDTVLCAGDSLHLFLPGFDSYNWSPATGLSCTDCPDVTLSPGTTTTYYLLASTVDGCVLHDTFTVEVFPIPEVTINISFCPGESVVIDGVTYTQPGTVSGIIPASNGCDTIATYILELAPQPTVTKTFTFCPGESVVIDGVTYTQPGTVSGVIPAAVGCDTLATYVLELAPQPTVTKTFTFCPGESVMIDGVAYTQPGTVSGVIPATVGCDTLATYVLELAPQPTVTKAFTFCPGESVVIDGVTYTQPGTVSGVIPAAVGCDTLATYVLKFATPAPSNVNINCPANIDITIDPGAGPTVATYNLPSASSDCPCPGLSLQMTAGLASGSAFPPGLTKVCYQAKDSCGNTAFCCFDVMIHEEQACDVKKIGCMTYELLSITKDAAGKRTYRIRVTNSCANPLTYTAIQLPNGIVAKEPANNAVYTAPSGRNYEVRNPNYSPFYSLRFKSTNDSIANGESDIFEYVLPPQAQPAYIHITSRLEPQVFYEAHLNTFYCPVGVTPVPKAEARSGPETVSSLNVFPNPTTGTLYVDMSSMAGERVQIQIFDSRGKRMQTIHENAEEAPREIQLSEGLANGMYFMEIQNESGERLTTRFVIQR